MAEVLGEWPVLQQVWSGTQEGRVRFRLEMFNKDDQTDYNKYASLDDAETFKAHTEAALRIVGANSATFNNLVNFS